VTPPSYLGRLALKLPLWVKISPKMNIATKHSTPNAARTVTTLWKERVATRRSRRSEHHDQRRDEAWSAGDLPGRVGEPAVRAGEEAAARADADDPRVICRLRSTSGTRRR